MTPLPPKLGAARLNVHYAAQLVAAVGNALAPKNEDFSHTALTWDPELSVALGAVIGRDGLRAGLSVSGLELVLVSNTGTLATVPLAGMSLDEAQSSLSSMLAELIELPPGGLVRPEHDLPEHGLAEGAPLEVDEVALQSLSQWLDAAGGSLETLVKAEPAASTPRLWPHHLDIAVLLDLESESESESGRRGENARSIGVGMSLGDGSYPEPYWYVTPWPYPDPSRTADVQLRAGHWHTGGFFAAILTATEMGAIGPEGPAGRADAFISSAIDASRTLLSDGE